MSRRAHAEEALNTYHFPWHDHRLSPAAELLDRHLLAEAGFAAVDTVSGPPEEQGHISFIALSTGGYTIKRKWFAEDAVRRGERHYKEPAEIPDLEAYLRKRFAVDVVAYPPFQRVQYDINFESLATGHVYGIFFDQPEQIAQWLEDFLVRHDIETRRGVYSKLSFLRDNAAAVS